MIVLSESFPMHTILTWISFFKIDCVLLPLTKVASASKGLLIFGKSGSENNAHLSSLLCSLQLGLNFFLREIFLLLSLFV